MDRIQALKTILSHSAPLLPQVGSSIIEQLERELNIKLREGQRHILSEAIRRFDLLGRKPCVFAINAPTGIGKTLTSLLLYLLIRRYTGQEYTCVVATRTRNQLFCFARDTWRFFGFYPPILLAKEGVCKFPEPELKKCSECPHYYTYCSENEYKTIIDLVNTYKTLDPYVIAQKFFQKTGKCPYHIFPQIRDYLYYEEGIDAWLVATYPYFLRDFLTSRLMDVVEIKGKIVWIVDEAHNIEQFVLVPDITISASTVEHALLEMRVAEGQIISACGRDTYQLAVKILRYIKTLLAKETDDEIVLSPTFENEIYEMANQDIETLRDVQYVFKVTASSLLEILSTKGEGALPTRRRFASYRIYKLFSVLIKKLEAEIENDQSEIREIVFVQAEDRLEVRRTDPTVLYKRYMEGKISNGDIIVLMSGTLPDADYLVNIWGIPQDRLIYIDASNYRIGQAEYVIVTSVTSKYEERSEDMYERYARELYLIYKQARRHVLALAPSYSFAQEVYQHLVKIIPSEEIVLETRKTKIGEVEELAVKKDKLLIIAIAGGKLAEGVELVRNERSLISDVVIIGIPYPRPTSYWKLIEQKICSKLGYNAVWQYRTMQAWVKIRQALGRGIRNPQDICTWWLMDSRFTTRTWMRLISKDKVRVRTVQSVEDLY